jgi:hypothetical protein
MNIPRRCCEASRKIQNERRVFRKSPLRGALVTVAACRMRLAARSPLFFAPTGDGVNVAAHWVCRAARDESVSVEGTVTSHM